VQPEIHAPPARDPGSPSQNLFAIAAAIWIGCPDCPPGREARILFFELDFARNLLTALAPFIVTLGAVCLVMRAIATRRVKGDSDASDG